jgi:hypothetical protein
MKKVTKKQIKEMNGKVEDYMRGYVDLFFFASETVITLDEFSKFVNKAIKIAKQKGCKSTLEAEILFSRLEDEFKKKMLEKMISGEKPEEQTFLFLK